MAETWNADNPILTNSVASDVPDIEENFDYLMHRFGYRISNASDQDQGATASVSGQTIYDIKDGLSAATDYAVVFFPHHMKDGATTKYSLDTSLDCSSNPNLYFYFQPGAYLDQVTGDEVLTVYSPRNIISAHGNKIFDGDMIDFNYGGTVYPEWWVANATPGTTVMTNGIQYAINSVPTRGGMVKFSHNLYLSAKITLKAAVVLQGSLRGDVTVANGTELYLVNSTDDYLVYASSVNNFEIRDMGFNGNKANQAGVKSTIYIDSCAKFRLNNIRVRNSDNHGIEIVGGASTSFVSRNVHINAADGAGATITAVDSILDNWECGANGTHGLHLIGAAAGNFYLTNLKSYSNGKSGLVLEDMTNTSRLSGAVINSNDENGILVDNSDYQQIENAYIVYNGQDGTAGDNDQAGIQLTNASTYNSFIGCYVYWNATQLYSYALNGCTHTSIVGGLIAGSGGTARFYLNGTNQKLFLDTESTIEVTDRWLTTGDGAATNVEIYHKYIDANTTSGNVTATLPAVADTYIGQEFIFMVGAGANNLIIEGDGAETINGGANYTITTIYTTAKVVSKGTSWRILSQWYTGI